MSEIILIFLIDGEPIIINMTFSHNVEFDTMSAFLA